MFHEATPSLARLRFVTSFPRDFSDEALQAMRDCDRICRYLHVPAQTGSDRILKMMNRGYTAGQYREFIDRARSIIPDVSLASDCIVGFPTETDADFQQTVQLTRACRFKNSFIFKYSPRPGTTAIDRFTDDVPEEVKRKRNAELLAVQSEVCAESNAAMIGRTVQVLVEGESKLVAKPAYPSSPGGTVQLGWKNKSGRFNRDQTDGRSHSRRSDRRLPWRDLHEGPAHRCRNHRCQIDDPFRQTRPTRRMHWLIQWHQPGGARSLYDLEHLRRDRREVPFVRPVIVLKQFCRDRIGRGERERERIRAIGEVAECAFGKFEFF